jgi:hypothetical protein
MQIFGRGEGGPIITCDAVDDVAAFKDVIRTCNSPGCSYIPITTFEGTTWVFDIYVQYGANGKFKGTVSNLATGKTGFVEIRSLGALSDHLDTAGSLTARLERWERVLVV